MSGWSKLDSWAGDVATGVGNTKDTADVALNSDLMGVPGAGDRSMEGICA